VKTALLIGGTGLLGRGIHAELSAAGWRVSNVTRGAGLPAGFHDSIIADRAVSGALAAALHGRAYDLVVDCAVYAAADAAEAVRALAGRCGHYIFVGTDFVYAATPRAPRHLTEDAPKNHALPYAAEKLAAEEILRQAHSAQAFPATMLRPPHILGAGKPAGFAPHALRDPALAGKLRAGQPVRLLDGGLFLIQPVWSREIGRAVISLAGNPASFGLALNCAGRDVITTRRYYEICAEVAGASTLTVENIATADFVRTCPGGAHQARDRAYDLSRLAALGFHPTLTVEAALRETLAAVPAPVLV
jgi:nucleoside-diphosphate-sugar epimerase